jgi:hypothetical protein
MRAKQKVKKALETWYGRLLLAALLTLAAALLILAFYQLFTPSEKIVSLITPSLLVTIYFETMKQIREEKRRPRGRDRTLAKKITSQIEEIKNLNDLVARLSSSIKTAGITTYEIVRNYDKPVKAILLMKFRETIGGKRQVVLKDRLKKLGFKFIWGGVRILPPVKTPQYLDSQKDLDRWIRDNIIDGLDPEFKYVFPFATLLDMSVVFSERKGAPEVGPSGRVRTLFEELGADDFDPGVVYSCIKKRHVSIEDLIRQGDIVFLASKSLDSSTRERLEHSKEEITNELKKATGVERLDLSYFSSMDKKGERKLSAALKKGHVSDEKAVAKGIIHEAKFWDRFLREH